MSINEAEIRAQVERWLKKRNEFFSHLVSFITVNIFLWGLYFVTSGFVGFPWPLLVTGGWGIGLVAHLMDTLAHSPQRVIDRERIVQRLVEQEKARRGIYSGAMDEYEKPKRKSPPISRATLSDDGELVTEDEAYPSEPRQQQQRQN